MNDAPQTLADRIAARLIELGISERAASLKATGQPDTLRFIRTRGVMPSWPKIVQIAEALDTNTEYLLGESDHPSNRSLRKIASRAAAAQEQSQSLNRDRAYFELSIKQETGRTEWYEAEIRKTQEALEKGEAYSIKEFPYDRTGYVDLPVCSSTIGQEQVFRGGGDRVIVPLTTIKPQVIIAAVHRPPSLMGKVSAYAFHIKDAAMGSSSGMRDNLIICDPSWPPTEGDEVVVHLRSPADTEGSINVLYRRLSDIGPEGVGLTQFDPATSFFVARDEITAVHRVASIAEILGLPSKDTVHIP